MSAQPIGDYLARRFVHWDGGDYFAEHAFLELRKLYPQINREHTTVEQFDESKNNLEIPFYAGDPPRWDGITVHATVPMGGCNIVKIVKTPGWRARGWRIIGELFNRPKWIARGESVRFARRDGFASMAFTVKHWGIATNLFTISVWGLYEPNNDRLYIKLWRETEGVRQW